ncbi:MAG: elongation factor G [Planctomycetes bacterium]|nr:elongation factor G [Planctomycetota bacterium]
MSDVQHIRNLALVGQGGAGKTSLAEALLFKAKATARLGRVDDGSSILDFDPDEKERGSSIDSAVGRLTHLGTAVTLIDTPGLVDFQGEAIGVLRAVETALIVVGASSGIGVNTRAMWGYAEREGIGRALVISRMDAENVNAAELVEALRETFGARCVPFNLNVGEGPEFAGVTSCLEPPAGAGAEVKRWHEALVEAAVEADEAVMERYLEQGDIAPEELRKLIGKAIVAGTLVPIFFTSVTRDIGVSELLDAIAAGFPGPLDGPVRRFAPAADGPFDRVAVPDPEQPFLGQVFKIVTDDYVGKLAFFRVFSGTVHANTTFHLVRADRREKMTNILWVHGKETRQVEAATAGQILAMARVEAIAIGDVVTAGENVYLPPIPFPTPMVSLALEPKSRGDETKIGPTLQKLADEDPSLIVRRDSQTHETVLTGLSDLHLKVKLSRMVRRYKVEVTTRLPKIPYLETITAEGDAQYRHKKQTGGAGQFAEVWLRIRPKERGEGFEFKSAVVGGAISQSFLPSIEKGVKQVMEQGVLAGCPVRDVYVEVYDGKEHPVDSKDIAFQIAGREAFKQAMLKARPVLLEPIMDVEIVVPTRNMGDITSDLNSRRGRIMGMDSQAGVQIIRAQIPLAEMQTYSTELRSLTGGEGTYTARPSRYDIVPPNLAEEIRARHARARQSE